MKALAKIYDLICRAEMTLVKGGIAIFTGLVFVSAVARTLRRPVGWAIDIAIFLFVWCVFFCADIAMRQGKLVTVDIVTMHLPKRVRYYLQFVNHTLIALFLMFLIGYSIPLAFTSRFVRFQGIVWFSYTWVVLSMTIGATLLLITTVLKMREHYIKGC
ncbi:MAG: hypothetical protein DDT36_01101 [Firmicutes bacterium]|nr:hypothetical protein [Bacillota bacterium]